MSKKIVAFHTLSESEKKEVLDLYGEKHEIPDIPMKISSPTIPAAAPMRPAETFAAQPAETFAAQESREQRSEKKKKPVGRIVAVAAIICAMLVGGGITAAVLSDKNNPTAGVNAVSEASETSTVDYSAVDSIVVNNQNHSYKKGVLTIYSDDYFSSDYKEYMALSKVETIKLESGVTYVRSRAFKDCSGLKNVEIADTVKTIGEGSFEGCTALAEISLPEGVESIESGAFSGCTELLSITIPASVKNIGYFPFANCSKIESINVQSGNTEFSSVDGVLYNKDKTVIIKYPLAKTDTEFTIPDGVVTVYPHSFASAVNLTKVTLPDSVSVIGDRGFTGCKKLSDINMPDNLKGIGMWAFSGCTSLKSITVPASVGVIGHSAFNRWASSQTIVIKGKEKAPDTWSEDWNDSCNASITWES